MWGEDDYQTLWRRTCGGWTAVCTSGGGKRLALCFVNGELVCGNIEAQAHQAIRNLLAILKEAGYGTEHVVRCGVWLDDARDFHAFNTVFRQYFGANPPARACVMSSMVLDCKVEIDCVAYKKPSA